MSGAATPGVILTVLALTGLLATESRGGWLPWVFKPLASTGFLWVAWACGALETAYGRVVCVALVLCWLGDVLLIPKGSRSAFLAGLTSFLLGHLAFVVAFLLLETSGAASGLACLFVVPAAGAALGWLHPHVPRVMVVPVWAYVLVISSMVLAAAGATGGTGRWAILAGAVAFYVSDLAVARERFVSSTPWNRMWGLPLYYAATLILATTVAG